MNTATRGAGQPPRDDHDDGHDHRPGRIDEHRFQPVQHRADRGDDPVEDAGALDRQPVEPGIHPGGHRRVVVLLLYREVGDPGLERRIDPPDREPVERERHDREPQQAAQTGPRPAQARCRSGGSRPPAQILFLVAQVGVEALHQAQADQQDETDGQDRHRALRRERSLLGDPIGDLLEILRPLEERGRVGIAGKLRRLVLCNEFVVLEGEPFEPDELVRPQLAPPAPADLDEREHLQDQERPEESPQAAGRAPEGAGECGRRVPRPGETDGRLDLLELAAVVLRPGAGEVADRAGKPVRGRGESGLLHQWSPPLIPLRSVALSTTPTSVPPSVITMG